MSARVLTLSDPVRWRSEPVPSPWRRASCCNWTKAWAPDRQAELPKYRPATWEGEKCGVQASGCGAPTTGQGPPGGTRPGTKGRWGPSASLVGQSTCCPLSAGHSPLAARQPPGTKCLCPARLTPLVGQRRSFCRTVLRGSACRAVFVQALSACLGESPRTSCRRVEVLLMGPRHLSRAVPWLSLTLGASASLGSKADPTAVF